jgi:hypothetical protein
MRLVFGSYYLNLPGGAVSYFVTAAEQLQRLGHDVVAFTRETGPMAEWLSDRGIAVVGPGDLPEECDAVLVQDAPCSYELAERFPRVPQVFVSHGAEYDMEVPPQVPNVVGAVVVMNDRVRARVEGMGLGCEIVRLRQPIDFTRFMPRLPARPRPRLAVLLGNYLGGPRREVVTGALEQAGIEWRQLGRQGEIVIDPERVLAEADIVIGYGRSILEGMSAGCAAYVFEYSLDGWVTADTYAAMEADGFAGTAFDDLTDPGRLERDLAAYDPEMGAVNRELTATRHNMFEHANELAALLGSLAPRPAETRQAGEMARIVRLHWEAYLAAKHWERELDRMHRRAVAAEERALEAEGRLEEIKSSARYRLAQRLARPLERIRGPWRR